MADRERYARGPARGAATVGTMKLTTVGAPAAHALQDRVEDRLDGRAPADLFKRSAGMRSLYG